MHILHCLRNKSKLNVILIYQIIVWILMFCTFSYIWQHTSHFNIIKSAQFEAAAPDVGKENNSSFRIDTSFRCVLFKWFKQYMYQSCDEMLTIDVILHEKNHLIPTFPRNMFFKLKTWNSYKKNLNIKERQNFLL